MTQTPSVTIEREFNAPVDQVFHAWTRGDHLQQWFYGPSSTGVGSVEVDLKVGGRYRIEILGSDGNMIVFGTYTRIEPPHLIEFTWKWEQSSLEPTETLVRIELEPLGERTRLRLIHSKFSSEQSFQAHDKGWLGVFTTLDSYLEKESKR